MGQKSGFSGFTGNVGGMETWHMSNFLDEITEHRIALNNKFFWEKSCLGFSSERILVLSSIYVLSYFKFVELFLEITSSIIKFDLGRIFLERIVLQWSSCFKERSVFNSWLNKKPCRSNVPFYLLFKKKNDLLNLTPKFWKV